MNRRSFLKRLTVGLGIAAGVSVVADRVKAINRHLPCTIQTRPGFKLGDPYPLRVKEVQGDFGRHYYEIDRYNFPSWDDIHGGVFPDVSQVTRQVRE